MRGFWSFLGVWGAFWTEIYRNVKVFQASMLRRKLEKAIWRTRYRIWMWERRKRRTSEGKNRKFHDLYSIWRALKGFFPILYSYEAWNCDFKGFEWILIPKRSFLRGLIVFSSHKNWEIENFIEFGFRFWLENLQRTPWFYEKWAENFQKLFKNPQHLKLQDFPFNQSIVNSNKSNFLTFTPSKSPISL